MTWLAPGAFAALALLAGPVIVHLLARRNARRLVFPATHFVRATPGRGSQAAAPVRHRPAAPAPRDRRGGRPRRGAAAADDAVAAGAMERARRARRGRRHEPQHGGSGHRRAAGGRGGAERLRRPAREHTGSRRRHRARGALAADGAAGAPGDRPRLRLPARVARRGGDRRDPCRTSASASSGRARRRRLGARRRAPVDGWRGGIWQATATVDAAGTRVSWARRGAAEVPPWITVTASAADAAAADRALRAAVSRGVPAGDAQRRIIVRFAGAPPTRASRAAGDDAVDRVGGDGPPPLRDARARGDRVRARRRHGGGRADRGERVRGAGDRSRGDPGGPSRGDRWMARPKSRRCPTPIWRGGGASRRR